MYPLCTSFEGNYATHRYTGRAKMCPRWEMPAPEGPASTDLWGGAWLTSPASWRLKRETPFSALGLFTFAIYILPGKSEASTEGHGQGHAYSYGKCIKMHDFNPFSCPFRVNSRSVWAQGFNHFGPPTSTSGPLHRWCFYCMVSPSPHSPPQAATPNTYKC